MFSAFIYLWGYLFLICIFIKLCPFLLRAFHERRFLMQPLLLSSFQTAQVLLKVLKHSGWMESTLNLNSNADKSTRYSSNAVKQQVETSQVGGATQSSIVHEKEISQTEAQIGGLLLRHILQLVCNAHAITDIQVIMSGLHDYRNHF